MNASSSWAARGLRPPVECLPDALHLFWYRKVAYTHFPQIMVHVLAKAVKKSLPQVPQLGILCQPVKECR